MLTIADLDKVDRLNDDTISSIKAAKFSVDFEVYLRTQYAVFMAATVEDYNVLHAGTH